MTIHIHQIRQILQRAIKLVLSRHRSPIIYMDRPLLADIGLSQNDLIVLHGG